ncbi:CoA-binding protein [Hydrogenoanaerobacterium sp.]|uniref:acetate--CoA ligase family protein n=1 Tax=Hydrogenoanaerobacterium sp. TaxID=2953763 RepID=UPI0028A0CB92|nr:CoA-binding protein [Hydrogenoanaerobacterium sp.]
MSLDSFYYPKSIAIIGASNNIYKAGCQVANNMIRLGFEGKVFFVNPKETEILGQPVYKSLLDIPEPVELIEISIPAKGCVEIFEQAEKRGDVKAAIVMASGFSETKIPENIEMERKMLEIAKRAGIRVIGPNCVGVMNTENHLDTTFAADIAQRPGGMSVISQSGSVGASLLSFVCDQPVPMGFNKWGHVGNMSDVTTEEILRYYKDDLSTEVIAMYMEGMTNARDFFETAKDVVKKKPMIVLKVGRSDIGAVAAASHTGSLAGSDNIFDGTFEQVGIIRADTIEEMVDTSKAFSMAQMPKGNRIAILTEAGGPGVISMDVIGNSGGIAQLAHFSEETKAKLREILPPMALISHPDGYVDMTAGADGPQHADALEAILRDENVDAVLLFSVPPTFLVPNEIARVVCEKMPIARELGKPVYSCFMAGNWVREACGMLENAGIPTFEMPQRAAKAMVNVISRLKFLQEQETGGLQNV